MVLTNSASRGQTRIVVAVSPVLANYQTHCTGHILLEHCTASPCPATVCHVWLWLYRLSRHETSLKGQTITGSLRYGRHHIVIDTVRGSNPLLACLCRCGCLQPALTAPFSLDQRLGNRTSQGRRREVLPGALGWWGTACGDRSHAMMYRAARFCAVPPAGLCRADHVNAVTSQRLPYLCQHLCIPKTWRLFAGMAPVQLELREPCLHCQGCLWHLLPTPGAQQNTAHSTVRRAQHCSQSRWAVRLLDSPPAPCQPSPCSPVCHCRGR